MFIYQDSLLKLYNQLIKNGSNLERLIFSILVIYYNKEFTEEKLFELHELCMEYVQGIEQILENALFHAVNVNGRITGKALFTIRIRSMSSNPWYKTYIDKELGYDSVNNNAIEIYLTDLQYEKFESITDKFKINIKKRMLLLNNDTEFYNKWEQKINLIQLKHLFGDIDLSKQNIYEKNNLITDFYNYEMSKNLSFVPRWVPYGKTEDSAIWIIGIMNIFIYNAVKYGSIINNILGIKIEINSKDVNVKQRDNIITKKNCDIIISNNYCTSSDKMKDNIGLTYIFKDYFNSIKCVRNQEDYYISMGVDDNSGNYVSKIEFGKDNK